VTAMANKVQRRKLRFQRKLSATTIKVQQYIKAGLPAAAATVDDSAGVIKAMRALGSLGMPAKQRRELRAKIVDALPAVMKKDLKLRPTDFGVDDLDLLADLFVRMLERVRYHRYGVNELRRKKAGLRGVFAGELFELLVLNMPGIQKELRGLAEGQLENLNRAMRRNKARLIDAHGADLVAVGEWSGIERVTDIVVHRGNQKLKFTDFAYVTYLAPKVGGPRLVSFLVETEVKLPRAASGFSDQMGVKQARFAGADRVEFFVPGRKQAVSFTPAEIVFDRGNINRVAITTTAATNESWRFRSTREGGYGEIYWRIGLVVDVHELRRLINAAF